MHHIYSSLQNLAPALTISLLLHAAAVVYVIDYNEAHTTRPLEPTRSYDVQILPSFYSVKYDKMQQEETEPPVEASAYIHTTIVQKIVAQHAIRQPVRLKTNHPKTSKKVRKKRDATTQKKRVIPKNKIPSKRASSAQTILKTTTPLANNKDQPNHARPLELNDKNGNFIEKADANENLSSPFGKNDNLAIALTDTETAGLTINSNGAKHTTSLKPNGHVVDVLSSATRKHYWQQYSKKLGALIDEHAQYPMRARRQGLEGTVVVQLRIRRDGTLISQHIEQSSGSATLDNAALRAILRIDRFPPFPREISDDEEHLFRIPYSFELS